MGAGGPTTPGNSKETKITPKAYARARARALQPKLCNIHSINLSLYPASCGVYSPTPAYSRKFEAVHTDFQRSIVSLPVNVTKRKRERNHRPKIPKTLSYGEGLLWGSLVTPNPEWKGGVRGERGCFPFQQKCVNSRPPGAGKVRGDRGPRPRRGPQRAAREARRGAGDRVLLTCPSPA